MSLIRNFAFHRLEHNAKRRIPKPDCLRKDPSAYTEEDIRSIESYEEKIRAREIDRAKYKLMLETEIERLRGVFAYYILLIFKKRITLP